MPLDFSNISALPPPPGVVPNFAHPHTRAKDIIAVSAICLSLMFPIILMRFYSRLWIARSFRGDDAACILAVVNSTVVQSAEIINKTWTALNVIGPHMWDVPIIALTTDFLRKEVIVFGILYGPTIFCAKLSLFLLYLHLFSPDRPTRYMIYFGIAVNFALYSATTALFGYFCAPRPGQSWLMATASTRCSNAYSMSYIQGVFNIVSDFYLLLLPVPVVWKLRLPKKKKIGVIGIFATGFLACMSSVLGLYYRIRLTHETDFSWNMLPVVTLVIIEVNVGIICGCMPHLNAFFRHHPIKLSPLRHLASRLVPRPPKRSVVSEKRSGETFDRVGSQTPPNDYYLGTQILKSSAQGAGRFLQSEELDRHEWLDHSASSSEGQGQPTCREKWDCRV